MCSGITFEKKKCFKPHLLGKVRKLIVCFFNQTWLPILHVQFVIRHYIISQHNCLCCQDGFSVARRALLLLNTKLNLDSSSKTCISIFDHGPIDIIQNIIMYSIANIQASLKPFTTGDVCTCLHLCSALISPTPLMASAWLSAGLPGAKDVFKISDSNVAVWSGFGKYMKGNLSLRLRATQCKHLFRFICLLDQRWKAPVLTCGTLPASSD